MINANTTISVTVANELPTKTQPDLQDIAGKEHSTGLLQYRHALYNYAMSMTRSREDSEDLVQETFARAIPGQKNLVSESNVKAWLFTILKHIWLNELRRRRSAPQSFSPLQDIDILDSIASDEPGPGQIYMQQVERERVQKSIQELSPRLREIIVLREYAELSYRDIAAALGCPLGTVMSRLMRARQKLHISLCAMT